MCFRTRAGCQYVFGSSGGDFPFSRLSFQDLGKGVHKTPLKLDYSFSIRLIIALFMKLKLNNVLNFASYSYRNEVRPTILTQQANGNVRLLHIVFKYSARVCVCLCV